MAFQFHKQRNNQVHMQNSTPANTMHGYLQWLSGQVMGRVITGDSKSQQRTTLYCFEYMSLLLVYCITIMYLERIMVLVC